jgi:hypothetical protein
MIRRAWLLCVACLATISTAARAGYDAAADFSPNHAWSYGWSQTLGSPFILDTRYENRFGLDFWEGAVPNEAPPGAFPIVFHNPTEQPVYVNGTLVVLPGQLGFHPGPGGEYGVVRFTAPADAVYSFDVAFSGLDFVGPTTTDVHVLVNGAPIFDGAVNAFGSGPSFSSSRIMQAGGTIDFAVGRGSNGSFLYDSTGLDVRIDVGSAAPVPEPGTNALMLGGLCLVGMAGLRRKAAPA